MAFFAKLEEKYLIGPKVLYFVTNLQYYTLHAFRPIFATEKFNVSISSYGKYTGLAMFVSFFTNIYIGAFSDRMRNHKSVLVFLTIITAIIMFNFYIPGLMKISIATFWVMIFTYLIFNNPKQPLLDKLILDYLARMPSGTAVYGKQRLWGTVAYGLATYITEWCLERGATVEKGKIVGYNWENMLYYSCVTTVFSAIAILFLVSKGPENAFAEATKQREQQFPTADTNPERAENTPAETVKQRGLQLPATGTGPVGTENSYMALLKNKEYLFFILIMFSNAITRSAMSMYLTIFHKQVLNLSPYKLPSSWPGVIRSPIDVFNKKPMTTLLFFGIAFEIIIMFVSDGLLSRLGLFWPLLIAQLCSLVRFFAYFVMPHNSKHAYGLSCIFELINGIYFGLAHMSAVQIASRLAPKHLRATSQMIYQGTFNALVTLLSGYIFGYMFDNALKGNNISGKAEAFNKLFLVNGFVIFITCLAFFFKYGIRDRVLFSREAEEAKLNAASLEIEA